MRSKVERYNHEQESMFTDSPKGKTHSCLDGCSDEHGKICVCKGCEDKELTIIQQLGIKEVFGVSEWLAWGEKRGYAQFWKEQWKKEIKESFQEQWSEKVHELLDAQGFEKGNLQRGNAIMLAAELLVFVRYFLRSKNL